MGAGRLKTGVIGHYPLVRDGDVAPALVAR
jgi:hypothetical protein